MEDLTAKKREKKARYIMKNTKINKKNSPDEYIIYTRI